MYTGPAALGSSTPQNVVYHYDLAGRLVEETATDGKLLVDYVYLEGRPLAVIRKQSSGEETFYYHNDHLGSPILMTDKLGKVVWNVAMDPFGNVIPYKGRHGDFIRNVVNNLRFPGQYYDTESGLHQNWHRDYDPKLGKYLETDPIGIDRGKNHLYIYAADNPVRFMDKNGLATYLGLVNLITFGEGAGAAVLYGPVRTKCSNGKRQEGMLLANYVGVTFGIPFTSTVFDLEVADGAPDPGDLRNMDGFAWIFSVGGAVGYGRALTHLILGQSHDVGIGAQLGIDFSASGMMGRSNVCGITEKCCEGAW